MVLSNEGNEECIDGYNPIKLSDLIAKRVSKVIKGVVYRKYFRFRGGRWYGGIATADTIGCNLQCKFCWAWYFRNRYDKGELLSPSEVFTKLDRIARRYGFNLLRLSGGEPTIAPEHLFEVLKLAQEHGYTFILETNGLLIGYYNDLAKRIANFNNVIVRVSFKGTNPKEFKLLTNACSAMFNYQLRAIENLLTYGLKPGSEVIVAVMISFSKDEDISKLLLRLASINPDLVNAIDWEVVIMYPHVKRILKAYKLRPYRYVNP